MRRLITFLLAALLIAGCSSTLPAADWCFRFDFRNSNYGFNQSYGEWIPGVGFRTDEYGNFLLNYTHSSPVTSTGIIITAARSSSVVVPGPVLVKADIFGVHVDTIVTEVPADVNVVDIPVLGSGSSAELMITGWSRTAPMHLISIQVRGTGSNPFSANNCDTVALVPEEAPGNLPIPEEVGDAIVEIDDSLASVDVPLTAPGGAPILPELTMLPTIFGHLKWIVSGSAAEELAGPFAPIVTALGIYLVMSFALTAVYFIVYAVVYIARWIMWLLNILMQFVQTIGALIGSVQGLLIIGGIALIVIGAGVIAANLESIGSFVDQIIQKINDVFAEIRRIIDEIIPG